MNTTTRHSEWEDIRGFDETKGEYIRLDCDAWLAAHRIREQGEKRGKRNLPDPSEKLPDAIYKQIESWVRKRALGCREQVDKFIHDKLAYLHDLHSHWETKNPEIDLDAYVAQRCEDLDSIASQSIGDLDKQRKEFEEAERDLERFRKDHRLSRVADYPNSKFAHWLWIPVVMIIESFMGANLLGSVSHGGVIEGWMVAIVLTIVNVLMGIWAGRMWCFTHYDWGVSKLFAYSQSAFCVLVALFWNTMAGHVRDVYLLAEKTGALEAPDEAFATAWRTMIERPLPWESLNSAGLALVGIFVFALTAYKSYTADDPFPGYGWRHRKAEDLRRHYQHDLNKRLDSLQSVRNEANIGIEEMKSRYQVDSASWENTLDKLRTVRNDYTMNLRQYDNDLDRLLAAYRDANLSVRTAESPPFFSTVPTIDQDVLIPPKFDIPEPPEWGDIPTKAEAGFKRVEETYTQLRTRFQMLDRIVDDYTEDTE